MSQRKFSVIQIEGKFFKYIMIYDFASGRMGVHNVYVMTEENPVVIGKELTSKECDAVIKCFEEVCNEELAEDTICGQEAAMFILNVVKLRNEMRLPHNMSGREHEKLHDEFAKLRYHWQTRVF